MSWTRSSPARNPPRPPQARQRHNTPKQNLIVAGRGNLGRSLAQAMKAAGHQVRLVPARHGEEALSKVVTADSVVFLAVPDGAVSDYSAALARSSMPQGVSVVHVSGALGLGALEPLRSRHAVGSFHPLQSFPEPRRPNAFQGITVAVDASTPALRRCLARLARDIGARPRYVDDGQRALYHASAVFASNYVIAVVGEGVQVLEAAGWSSSDAQRALIPLVEGVVANLRKRGTAGALTGPIRRGDGETVERHLRALHGLSTPQPEATYRMLGAVTLGIAQEAGLQPAAAERIKRALTRKVAATRRRGRS
jgi:predicted short-subunit dehydrogenase-like oxidoreductase (DUF2520 family)